ncbi:hypothetical protein L1887_49901 [Cichorium endivia]|nr:hypothetical protein L1887_49901 [Cichorium endivia]
MASRCSVRPSAAGVDRSTILYDVETILSAIVVAEVEASAVLDCVLAAWICSTPVASDSSGGPRGRRGCEDAAVCAGIGELACGDGVAIANKGHSAVGQLRLGICVSRGDKVVDQGDRLAALTLDVVVIVEARLDADGDGAAALELPEQRALRLGTEGGAPVADAVDELADACVAVGGGIGARGWRTHLDGQGALTDRVEQHGRAEEGGDARVHVEAHQTGGSEDERGVGTVGRVKLGEARVDVAANVAEDQVRVSPSQLGYAADGGGADDRADGQLVEHLVRKASLDHESVARVLALEHGGEFETLWQSGGDVLEAVYDGVDGALLESDLELLGPDGLAFAADDIERRAQVLVAGGRHGGDGEGVWAQWSVGCGLEGVEEVAEKVDVVVGVVAVDLLEAPCFEHGTDVGALNQGELAVATGEDEGAAGINTELAFERQRIDVGLLALLVELLCAVELVGRGAVCDGELVQRGQRGGGREHGGRCGARERRCLSEIIGRAVEDAARVGGWV